MDEQPAVGELRSLPGEHDVLPLAAHENFSVASLVLGRETRAVARRAA